MLIITDLSVGSVPVVGWSPELLKVRVPVQTVRRKWKPFVNGRSARRRH